jgi:sensor histidine kinase regulating citrate/malate metabolism
VRRLFWLALGLGAGAAGAVLSTRFAKKQMQKVAPSTIAREARGGLLELSKLVSESIAEGKRAMEEAEAEARSSISKP